MFNQRRQYQSRELQVLDSIFQNLEKLYTLLIKVEPENLILDSGTATLTAGTVTVNTPNIKYWLFLQIILLQNIQLKNTFIILATLNVKWNSL